MRSPLRFFATAFSLSIVFLANITRAQFTNAVDQASNYGGAGEPAFSGGNSAGSGFGNWSFNSFNGGGFIGNPSAASITGMNSESFGLWANSGTGNYVNVDRSLSTAMGVGDVFSFQWGINWDSASGSKGFNLYTGGTGGTQVINVNNGGNQDITINSANTTFGYGTAVMTWTFNYVNATTLRVTANDRDGTGTYSNNFTVSGGIDAFRWYASSLGTDNRQPYFNSLLSTNSGVFTQGGTVTNNFIS